VNLVLKGSPADAVRSELADISDAGNIDVSGGNGLTSVSVTCNTERDIREDIYGRIKKQDWILLEMTRDVKSLERIFGELTKENPNL